MLRPDFDEQTKVLVDWTDGTLAAAIEKRWVRKVIFCISTEDPAIDIVGKTVQERYEFVIAFPFQKDDKFFLSMRNTVIPVNPMSKDAAHEALVQMSDSLWERLCQLKPPPEARWLSLRVVYDPDILPPDFTGHSEKFAVQTISQRDLARFGPAGPVRTLPLGRFDSRYHVCKVQMVAELDIFAEGDDGDAGCGEHGMFSQQSITPGDSVSQNPRRRERDDAAPTGMLHPHQLRLQNVITGTAAEDDVEYAKAIAAIFLVSNLDASKSWSRKSLHEHAQLPVTRCDEMLTHLFDLGLLTTAPFNRHVKVAVQITEIPWLRSAMLALLDSWKMLGFPAGWLEKERKAFFDAHSPETQVPSSSHDETADERPTKTRRLVGLAGKDAPRPARP